MQFDRVINRYLKESKTFWTFGTKGGCITRTDSKGVKRHYILDDDIKRGSKYTGKFLMINYGYIWLDELDDEDMQAYFIIKDDKEVVRDEEKLLTTQAHKDSDLIDMIDF